MAIAWMITDLVELIHLVKALQAARWARKSSSLCGISLSALYVDHRYLHRLVGHPSTGFELKHPNAVSFLPRSCFTLVFST